MPEQQFTWLPFFNEMLTVICKNYTPQSLALVFKRIFPKQQDEETKGIKTDFKEIDPLTFIACFNRSETKESREAFCKIAKEELHLNAPIPTDFDGIPVFNNQKTWFLQYSYLRGKKDCDILWNFAQNRVESLPVTKEEMEKLLSLAHVGLTKISSFLFICFPNHYYPTDKNTYTFLGLAKEDSFQFFEQLQRVAKEKYPLDAPYELSFKAWKQAEDKIREGESPVFWAVGSDWGRGDQGDQIQRFIQNSIWECGYGANGKDKNKKRLEEVKPGDIFVLKSSATMGTGHKTPVTIIKNIGIVQSKNTWWSFNVNWQNFPSLPYRIEGKVLWGTIAPIQDLTILELVKNLMNESISSIRKDSSSPKFPLNQILYGPPGTGKTYHTVTKAVEIIDGKANPNYGLAKARFDELKKQGKIKFITFHQNYSYEDFMVGIRPMLNGEKITYKLYEGPFKQIADKAREDTGSNYVLIIDEINRGNISKIFGELITLIEDDKRAENEHAMSAPLLYQQAEFSVPNNLYIIGTMNTADKSIALVDIALRRRFVFEEMMPDESLLKPIEGFDLPGWFKRLNEKITAELDRDHQIGHSYFMEVKNKTELKQKFYQCILPLLKEYFYGNPEKLETIIPGFEQDKQLDNEKFIEVLNSILHDKTNNDPGMEED